MSNTLTGLIPTLYTALDQVSRELIGFIPNVSVNATAEQAAKGQTVRAPVVPQNTLEDITPGNDPADSGDQTIGYTDVTISESKAYPIRWEGEEQLSLSEYGTVNVVLADQFAQGFRTLANAVESDLAGLYKEMARATGTGGTTPFGTADDHSDFANANRVLDELGAPQEGRVMIVGSASRAKLEGKQSGLFKVNEAGDAGALLRDRQMRMLHGFMMGFSAQVKSHTAGAGASAALSPTYLVDNGSGYVAGETDINIDTGTGAFVDGDVIEVGGYKYVVTGPETGGADTVLNLAEPGLQEPIEDGDIVLGAGNYTANMFFHRNALLLAARQPAMPIGGDDADDVTTVTDPVSGLSFQVAIYRQYRRVKYEIGLAWGVAAPNGKHGGILLG